MYKLSFYDEKMVINYICFLLNSGLRSVSSIDELDSRTFFLEGRNIYISVG